MSLDVANIWEKLKDAKLDAEVGIQIVPIAPGRDTTYYVAEIPERVQAHVHRMGDEFYHVLKGEGIIHVGLVTFENNTPVSVDWQSPVKVDRDDVFNIPAGYAHSLRNTGGDVLIIGFVCSPNHLGKDRYIVDNPI